MIGLNPTYRFTIGVSTYCTFDQNRNCLARSKTDYVTLTLVNILTTSKQAKYVIYESDLLKHLSNGSNLTEKQDECVCI